jgi:hypothetical protein
MKNRLAMCRWMPAGTLAVLVLSLSFVAGVAQSEDLSPPANARVSRYGGGWECERGYSRARASCVPVEVPSGAFLDEDGHGWRCERGYRKTGESCVAVAVPPNAFLTEQGSGWTCERGFSRSGNTCAPVSVPERLDPQGGRCPYERGFMKSAASAVRGAGQWIPP